jgi:hypothetical protein
MLPVTENGMMPDWDFMHDFQFNTEQEILKPTLERLCKRLIISELVGGVNPSVQIGKNLFLARNLQLPLLAAA